MFFSASWPLFSAFVLFLLMVLVHSATHETLKVGKCKNVDAQLKSIDAKYIQELSKVGEAWPVKFTAIDPSVPIGNMLLSSMTCKVINEDGKSKVQFLVGMAGAKGSGDTYKETIIKTDGKVLLTDSNDDGTADTKYHVLHAEEGKYMYIYKCSTKDDANTNLDARYVLVDKNYLPANPSDPKLTAMKEQINNFDESLVSTGVFSGKIYYIS